MQEQTAILIQDQDEWFLFIDSDDEEPDGAWKDVDSAIEELRMDGWEIVQGPASIRSDIDGPDQHELWGYILKRSVQ
jgi:hypothetical protein